MRKSKKTAVLLMECRGCGCRDIRHIQNIELLGKIVRKGVCRHCGKVVKAVSEKK